jgi:hypothetical protein
MTGIPPYVKENKPMKETSSIFDVFSTFEYFIFPDGHAINP